MSTRKVTSDPNANASHAPAQSSTGEGGFVIRSHRTLALLALLTIALKSLIFAPIGVWPLAFVCLVPWLIFVSASRLAPRVYLYSYLMALVFFLINMRWLYYATGIGYVALSIYQAAYFPLLACTIRHAVRRRGWPLAIVFPLLWTGSEILRAVVISGFPWFFLSHSLHSVLSLIQISDAVGAYGVSFLIAAVNGAIADLIFARLRPSGEPTTATLKSSYGKRARRGVVFASIALIATFTYGQYQLRRDTMQDGPRVAIVQGDFLMTVTNEEAPDSEKRTIYYSMLAEAAKQDPDLFVLPETPWIMYLNPEMRDFDSVWRESFAALQRRASQSNAYLITGSGSLIQTPLDLLTKQRRHNSAMLFHPGGTEPDRYDKVHVVYFGETVPFRFGRLRFLYFWFNSLMPFSGADGTTEYSLFPGSDFSRFEIKAPSCNGRTFRLGIPICYEDVMPYVARRFVGAGGDRKMADLLINISNDGWFGRGVQQAQHLAICVFRAVENRVGIARSVNTGISALIDPNGLVHDRVWGDEATPWPRACGFAVGTVKTDSRFTLYTRYGDWFAWACALFWLVFFIDYWIARAKSHTGDA